MLRNKGFWGPKQQIFYLVYLKKKNNILRRIIEQKLYRIMI